MNVKLLDLISEDLKKVINLVKQYVNESTFKKIENVIVADIHLSSSEVIIFEESAVWDEVFIVYYILSKCDLGNESFQSIYDNLLSIEKQDENIQIEYKKFIIEAFRKTVDSIKQQIGPNESSELNFSSFEIFEQIDKATNSELTLLYKSTLYRICELIVKVDDCVTEAESKKLNHIYSLFNKNSAKIKVNKEDENVQNKTFDLKNEKELNESNFLDELNNLVGLNDVKSEINTLVNFLKIQNKRKQNGLPVANISQHVVFTGNPGTGKTTVARLLASIYKSLGFLEKGQLIETDRSSLVAGYTGQTAIKTTKKIDEAIGGVLFIDEAYSLANSSSEDSFGREAIDTILKRMEDNRDDFIVIVAGYSKNMSDFINTNPGLKSRFNKYIHFDDYTENELLMIIKKLTKKAGYKLSESAEACLIDLFEKLYNKRDDSFGNGRLARNIFEKTIENQANRIASIPNLTEDILTILDAEDIPTTA